ncbi:MAG: hypothetical protein JWO33_1999 [Caulobacteraceae bacterium]|nr:hypothetical protein [Caulobacteraceae bacterium]
MKSLTATIGLALALVAGAAQAAPSAGQIALAKRYMDAAQMSDSVAMMMKQLRPVLMQKAEAELSADQKKVLGEAFDVAYGRYLDSYMSRLAPILADTYSEAELTQIVAFYESPVGRSMVAKAPALQLKLVPVAMDLVPDLEQDMRTEVCAHINCGDTPAPRRSDAGTAAAG